MSAATIVCPRCADVMHRVERSGVTIDRCSRCGGVFLDRGELQALLRAEAEYHTGAGDLFEPADEDDEDPARKRTSRRGFLEELFDFG